MTTIDKAGTGFHSGFSLLSQLLGVGVGMGLGVGVIDANNRDLLGDHLTIQQSWKMGILDVMWANEYFNATHRFVRKYA